LKHGVLNKAKDQFVCLTNFLSPDLNFNSLPIIFREAGLKLNFICVAFFIGLLAENTNLMFFEETGQTI
jgi:hypothetical protein